MSCGCETAAPATDQAHEGGRDLCGPTEVRTKATCEGTQNKRVDFRGNVKTPRRESLCATGDKSVGEDLEADPRNRGKTQGR